MPNASSPYHPQRGLTNTEPMALATGSQLEPMALATGIDCAAFCPMAPEASAYGSERRTFSTTQPRMLGFSVNFSLLVILLTTLNGFSQEPSTTNNPSAVRSQAAEFGNATSPLMVSDIVLESLYRSGLYVLAVEHCERELGRSGTSRISNALWTARLITSVALRDSVAIAPEFTTISSRLQKAIQITQPAIDRQPQDVHSLWVRFSLANATYRVIERAMAAFLAAPANLSQRDDCLNSIRTLSDSLIGFRDEVQSAQGIASKLVGRDASGQVLDLATLRNNILLMQIDLILQRGRLFDSGSDDAIAAGSDAAAAIEQAMNLTEEQWIGRPSLELAQWEAALMIGKHPNVQEGIRNWIASHPIHELLSKAIAIAIQSSVATRDVATGDQWLALANERYSQSQPPGLAIAQLEWSLMRWQSAYEDNKASKEMPNEKTREADLELILNKRDAISAAFGDYWGLRAEATILRFESTSRRSKSNVSTDQTKNRQSMSMVKLQLKQLLAANRFEEAIERLRQSESIAAKNNDLEQAFELAKLQIGLLVKVNSAPQATNSDSQSARLVATAQQIEATSGTYASLTGAAELNQFAESLLMNAWKMEIDATEKSRLWNLYEQHCSDHLEQWPLSTTSPSVRQKLATAYLVTGRLESNLQLWINTPKEVAERSEQLVNAILLFESITRQKEILPQWRAEVIALKTPWLQLCRWLLTDWSWWTLDEGIARGIDGIDASLERLNVDSLATFIPETTEKSTPTANLSLDASILRLCEWIEKDPARRMGWAIATANAYLALIDDQFIFEKQPLMDSDRTKLVTTLKHLENVLQMIETESNKSLHLSVSQAIDDLRVSLTSRVSAIEIVSSQPVAELHQELLNRQSTFPRSAKWQQEVALVQLWQAKSNPSNRDALIEKSIQAYLKLASGNIVGSDGWFDARLRLARCYLLLGKDAQAREAVALTTAMVGKISSVWQKRSAQILPRK
ncbi:MAG: hypothetical protein NTW52_06615 [Planctomycetota bacterium]|nr:hypothetical protein [Planctomycetota bacterium]